VSIEEVPSQQHVKPMLGEKLANYRCDRRRTYARGACPWPDAKKMISELSALLLSMCLSSSSRPRAWPYVHAGVAPRVSLGLVLSAYARLEKGL
jgi:hypothetical protein